MDENNKNLFDTSDSSMSNGVGDIPTFDSLYTNDFGTSTTDFSTSTDFSANTYDLGSTVDLGSTIDLGSSIDVNSSVDFGNSQSDKVDTVVGGNPFSGTIKDKDNTSYEDSYTTSGNGYNQSTGNSTDSSNQYQSTGEFGQYEYNNQESYYVSGDSDKTSPLIITGFVFSIISLICSCIPILDMVFPVVAIVLCSIGIKKSTKNKLGKAGIIIASIALVFTVVIFIVNIAGGVMSSFFDFGDILDQHYEISVDTDNSDNSDDSDDSYTTPDYSDDDMIDERQDVDSSIIAKYNQVYVGGQVYTLPISGADIKDDFILDDTYEEELENGISEYASIFGSITRDDIHSKFYVSLYNKSEKSTSNIEDLYVKYIGSTSYYDDDWNEYMSDIMIYGGIRIGSTKDEVEKAFGKCEEPYENGSYSSYSYSVDSTYISITFYDDVISDISIGYYGD